MIDEKERGFQSPDPGLKVSAVSDKDVEAQQQQQQQQQQQAGPSVETMADSGKGNCWACGADNPGKVCSGCKVAKFCDGGCQKESWKTHKGMCKELSGQAAIVDTNIKDMKAYLCSKLNPPSYIADAHLGPTASFLGRLADVKKLIALGGSVNYVDKKSGFTPIVMAAYNGHVLVVQELLRAGALVNGGKKGQSALLCSSQLGHAAVVAVLLKNGAKIDGVNDIGSSPLHLAAEESHIDVLALLLDNGAPVNLVNKEGATALHRTAYNGLAGCMRLLLQHNADPLPLAYFGASTLLMAVRTGSLQCVAVLLETTSKQQLETPDFMGVRPLHMAITIGSAAMARLLLQAGANPVTRTNMGSQPLSTAVLRNLPEIVAMLVQRGAPFDVPNVDDDGLTPLLYAATFGYAATVRVLLQAGADPQRPSLSGRTPLQVAAGKHPEVVALLEARIAELERERERQEQEDGEDGEAVSPPSTPSPDL